MPATDAQARRAIGRVRVKWDAHLEDPRDEKNQVHAHGGLLAVLLAAFACGRVRLRHVEDFSGDLGAKARKRLGLRSTVSDSTLYRVVSKQKPRGFRETVYAEVQGLLAGGVVKNDLFPLGVLTCDGKSLWTSTTKAFEEAKTSIDEKTGVMTASLMSLRAVLTSSQVRPCLDFEVIGDKEGEPPAFRTVLPRVVERFGAHFQIVTGDAGLACRENALLLQRAGKYALFGLKGNQPKLHALAQQLFRDSPGGLKRRSAESRNGFGLVRELHTVTVKDSAAVDMPGIQQLWRVVQSTYSGGTVVSEETRYFLSGIPPRLLSPRQQLALVRLHWGIENGHNWTMDVALLEDDAQPCQQSRDAIEVVAWLRVLGYNLLAAWRARAGLKDKQPVSWARCLETLRDAFLSGIEVLQVTPA